MGDDDAEFIELWNPTTHAVNLRGAKFTAGLSYDFPDNRDAPLAPGGRLVLCASQYNFQVRYGIEIPVAGVYFDRLGNDGDTLTLATSANVPLITMHYDDNAPWFDAADGGGYSLVLANRTPGANYDSALNWRASTAAGGNPGTDDTTLFPGGDLLAYALAANSLPALTRQLDGSLLFTFLRTPAADAVEYAVETSDTLAAWLTTEATLVSQARQPNGSVLMTWLIPGTVEPTKFARLRVTLR